MKKCPHCGEKIQNSAKKCRFCGEWLAEHQEHQDEVNSPFEDTLLSLKNTFFGLFLTIKDHWLRLSIIGLIIIGGIAYGNYKSEQEQKDIETLTSITDNLWDDNNINEKALDDLNNVDLNSEKGRALQEQYLEVANNEKDLADKVSGLGEMSVETYGYKNSPAIQTAITNLELFKKYFVEYKSNITRIFVKYGIDLNDETAYSAGEKYKKIIKYIDAALAYADDSVALYDYILQNQHDISIGSNGDVYFASDNGVNDYNALIGTYNDARIEYLDVTKQYEDYLKQYNQYNNF